MKQAQKINALAKYSEVEAHEISVSSYDENTFEHGSNEYMVLTDSEADEKVKSEIRESLWAFNSHFIIPHTKEGIDWNFEPNLKKMQEQMCESCNEVVFHLLADFERFADDAISADGRGHFLAKYDGEEIEIEIENPDTEDTMVYIYKQ